MTWALTPGPSIFTVTAPEGTPVRTKRPSSSTSLDTDVPATLTTQPLPPDWALTPGPAETLASPGARSAPWSTDAPPIGCSFAPVTALELPQPDVITLARPASSRHTTRFTRRMTLAS